MENIFSLQNPWRSQPGWRLTGLAPRKIRPLILNWIDEPEIIVIKGARQVGKTTLVQQIIYDLIHKEKVYPENIFYFSFDDQDLRNLVLQDPKSVFYFIQQQRTEAGKGRLFIFFDEIQKAPLILEILKMYYDSNKDYKFIITGSSSLELSKGVSESLLGRVVNFHLHSLTFQEILTLKASATLSKFLPEAGNKVEDFLQYFINHKQDFSYDYQGLKKIYSGLDFYKNEIVIQFNEYLLRGGYPGVAKKDKLKAEMILRNIKQVYIEKDIIATLKIGKHFAFSGLMELLAYQIGSLVNLEELCRNLKISFPTLKNFINILEKTYVIELLQPYFENQRKAVRKNRKSYFLDTGFRNACIGLVNLPGNPNEIGHLVENMTFNILRKANSYLFGESMQFFFYRTYDGAEIDFVLRKGNKIFPIEVKYQNFVREKVPTVMKNFMKTKGERCQKGLVVTKDFIGKKSYDFGEVYFIPLNLLVLGI
ncbi:ATP-binding protein [bacterium]|nr:ATP-binding protein [bacterium]MBU4511219.1 ATP-binding protein [bacterium]